MSHEGVSRLASRDNKHLLLTMPAYYTDRVYVTVECPSVLPSVCPVDRQQQRRAAGLLLSALRARDRPIDRWLRARCGCRAAGAGAQQQMRVASCR